MARTTLSAKGGFEISVSVEVWKEGQTRVAYTPERDVSSCDKTANQAKSNLRQAVSPFIEEAVHEGSLDEILEEAGFERRGKIDRPRPVIAREKMRLTLPAA